MARHPTSSRRPKKDAASEQEDAFLAKVYGASTWAEQNSQMLILLGVVLAVLVGGAFYYVNYRANLTEQAILQLEQIQQGVMVGDQEAAKTQLRTYIGRFDGTPHANEARLLLASLHLEGNAPDEALGVLEDSDLGLGHPLGVQVAILEGKAMEAAGRLDEAEEIYLDVADRAELGFQVVGALADAARVREHSDDVEGAAELYERILEELDETDPQRGYYQMKAAEARVRAEG